MSKLVISFLKYGYKISFVQEPPRVYLKNNASALKNSEFVTQAMTELLEAVVSQNIIMFLIVLILCL